MWKVHCRLIGQELWAQLISLLGKVVRPLGNGGLLGKWVTRGQALRLHSLPPFLFHSLLPDGWYHVTNKPPTPGRHHCEKMDHPVSWARTNPSSAMASCGYCITAGRKIVANRDTTMMPSVTNSTVCETLHRIIKICIYLQTMLQKECTELGELGVGRGHCGHHNTISMSQ